MPYPFYGSTNLNLQNNHNLRILRIYDHPGSGHVSWLISLLSTIPLRNMLEHVIVSCRRKVKEESSQWASLEEELTHAKFCNLRVLQVMGGGVTFRKKVCRTIRFLETSSEATTDL